MVITTQISEDLTMRTIVELIQHYPEGFAIFMLLLLFTREAALPIKIMIVTSVLAIALYHFTNWYEESVGVLVLGAIASIVSFAKKAKPIY